MATWMDVIYPKEQRFDLDVKVQPGEKYVLSTNSAYSGLGVWFEEDTFLGFLEDGMIKFTATPQMAEKEYITLSSSEPVHLQDFTIKLEKGPQATPWTPAPEDLTHGYLYTLSQPIQSDAWYTLSTDYTGDWQGLWIDNMYVGYLSDGKITFRSPDVITVDSDVVTKVLDMEAPQTMAKLEKGNKATDWTPALEDVDEAIDAVDTKYSNKVAEINTTIDSITQRVESTETNITTINGTVSSLSTRMDTAESKITPNAIVSTVTNSSEWLMLDGYVTNVGIRVSDAESSIEQHADLIASKVSQTDFTGETIVSLIEQTPSQIKLSADKIKLEGLVTANGNFKILTDGSIEARNVIVKDQNNQAIMTSQGLKMKYLFVSSGSFMGWDLVGIVRPGAISYEFETKPVYLFVYIPNDFIIDSAILHVKSMPFYLTDQPTASEGGSGAPDGYYHANNLRLYKVTDSTDLCIWVDGYHMYDSPIYRSRSRITTTPWNSNWSPTGDKIQVRSSDIKNHLTIGGRTILVVESNTTPSLANTRYQSYMQMEIEIEGYLKG